MSQRKPIGRRVALAGSVARAAYAAGLLFVPEPMGDRRLVPPIKGHPGGRLGYRGFGAIHMNLAGLTILAALRNQDLPRMLKVNISCDVSDLTAALLEWRARGRIDAAVAGGAVLNGAGVGMWVAALRNL